jgi:uncharacterized protein with PIN domain
VRLLCDAMLARLARWLRAAGYNTILEHTASHAELIAACRVEKRILISCDRALCARPEGESDVLVIGSDLDEAGVCDHTGAQPRLDRRAFHALVNS